MPSTTHRVLAASVVVLVCGVVLAWLFAIPRPPAEAPRGDLTSDATRGADAGHSERGDPSLPFRDSGGRPRVELEGSALLETFEGYVSYEGGLAPAGSSGFLLVALRRPDGITTPFRMPITHGMWSLDAAPSCVLELYRGQLAGTAAWPVLHELKLEAHARLEIELQTTPVVWVIDGVSGTRIPSVAILGRTPKHQGILPHEGVFGRSVVASLQDTPIPTDSLDAPGMTLLTAEGYEWGAVCITTPVSALVALDPAGTLRIVISKGTEPLPDQSLLRLLAPDTPRAQPALYSIPFTGSGEEYVLSKVREGDYLAEIVLNPRSAIESVLFSDLVHIERDKETTLHVRLKGSSAPLPTPVCFIVVGDEDALADITRLSIRPLSVRSMNELRRTSLKAPGDLAGKQWGVREFRFEELFPGSYTIEVEPLGHVERLTVPEDQVYLHEVALAPVRRFTITLTEKGTGRPLDIVWGMVSTVDENDSVVVPPSGRSLASHHGVVTFDAEEGELRLWLSVQGFEETGERYYVLDGVDRRHFDLQLERTGAITLKLQARGVPLFAPSCWWTELHVTSESGKEMHSQIEFPGPAVGEWHSEVLLQLDETGRYVLGMPALFGYERPIMTDLEVTPLGSTVIVDAESGSRVP